MLKLTIGLTREPRLDPLIDGAVKPQNIQLEFVLSSPGELHYRNLKYDEFDVFQMSISETLMTKDRQHLSKWQWSGLPVFLSKAFVWLNIFVNVQSNIHHLGDLKGKRVGVPDYPMTGALWMRIFLKDIFGVRPEEICWYVGRTKEFSHGAIFGLDLNPPPGVALNWLRDDQTLDAMLDAGEIDAAFGFPPRPHELRDFAPIDRYGGTPTVGNPRIRKLFSDAGRQIITQYFQKTGVIPPNHMFLVQNRILEKDPWVALELYKAFQKSKEMAYERARRLSSTYLLFEPEDYLQQAKTLGEDPYPLGVKNNFKMLEILIGASHEEGLIQKPLNIFNLFHEATLNT
jgi:4,5-dihydroxyphthalate decarboxylase